MQRFMTDPTNLYLFISVRVDPSLQNSQGGLEMVLSALLGKDINCTEISSFPQLKKERRRLVVILGRSSVPLKSKFLFTMTANVRWMIHASGLRLLYLLKTRSHFMI